MSPRTGRPMSEKARRGKVETRMNEQELEKLDFCCQAMEMSRSQLIRTGIDKIYASLRRVKKK